MQQLCAIPEIANSEEVQEFLALNTDARIAFVKKPFMVSRIDKVTAEPLCSALFLAASVRCALEWTLLRKSEGLSKREPRERDDGIRGLKCSTPVYVCIYTMI